MRWLIVMLLVGCKGDEAEVTCGDFAAHYVRIVGAADDEALTEASRLCTEVELPMGFRQCVAEAANGKALDACEVQHGDAASRLRTARDDRRRRANDKAKAADEQERQTEEQKQLDADRARAKAQELKPKAVKLK